MASHVIVLLCPQTHVIVSTPEWLGLDGLGPAARQCLPKSSGKRQSHIPTPLLMHWRGGIPPALKLFQCIIAVLCIAFFVCIVPNFIACLVSSFRYNGLATLALTGPSGPQCKQGGGWGASPPLKMVGMWRHYGYIVKLGV